MVNFPVTVKTVQMMVLHPCLQYSPQYQYQTTENYLRNLNCWDGAVPFRAKCGNKLVSESSFVSRVYDSVKNDFVRGILKSQTLADVLCKLVKNQDRITEAEWPSVIFEFCDRILPRRIFNSDIVPRAKQDIMFFINKGCVGIANVKRVPHKEDHKDYQ